MRPFSSRLATAIAFVLALSAAAAAAQAPTTLNYQGRLLQNTADQDAVGGTVDVVFSIWTGPTGDGAAVQLWSESWTGVALSNGIFSVLLGSNGSPLDPADFQSDSTLFLQLEIDGETLSPRQQLGSAPFALVDEPANEIQDLSLAGDTLSLSGSAATVDLATYLDNTDAQTLSLMGDTLSISGSASTVDLSPYGVDTDTDNQVLTLAGDKLQLTSDDGVDEVDLSAYLGNSLDAAYDQGGGGAGGTIYADAGPVTIAGGSLLQQPGDPSLAGSLAIGTAPSSVAVAGRYAFVVDTDSDDLKIVDVTDPSSPDLAGSLGIGGFPIAVAVAGRYAYVIDLNSGTGGDGGDGGPGAVLYSLKVIDVSDPGTPSLAGTATLGTNPTALSLSGRYVYVVDSGENDLKVVDVANPAAPTVAGSVDLGDWPTSVSVAGPYAYVVDREADDLKVVDVADPAAPTVVGVAGIGGFPTSVQVSGRYAYAVDFGADDLKVIDVANPASPSVVGSVGVGGSPRSVFVAGRYAYVANESSGELAVIDVADPTTPAQVGSLSLSGAPGSVSVSGRYAYVVSQTTGTLSVVDVSGAEVTGLIAHSLEAGQLQVRGDAVAQGNLSVASGLAVGPGGVVSDGDVGVAGTLALAPDVAPTSSPKDLVQLYAENVAGSAELRVRDEAGNVTTLSPHNFSLIGQASEPLAWSYFSESENGKINVDMLRALRVLERFSGETLVHVENADGTSPEQPPGDSESLIRRIEALERKLASLSALCSQNRPNPVP